MDTPKKCLKQSWFLLHSLLQFQILGKKNHFLARILQGQPMFRYNKQATPLIRIEKYICFLVTQLLSHLKVLYSIRSYWITWRAQNLSLWKFNIIYYKIIQIVCAPWLAIKPLYMSVCKHGFHSSFISYFIKEM